ncbi:hypothetical protein F8M41_018859, partial [Gigaspora margarita]
MTLLQQHYCDDTNTTIPMTTPTTKPNPK